MRHHHNQFFSIYQYYRHSGYYVNTTESTKPRDVYHTVATPRTLKT